MNLSFRFEPNYKIYLEGFPKALDYKESDPGDFSCSKFSLRNAKTQESRAVFVKLADLRDIGLSLTVLRSISNCDGYIKYASKVNCLLREALPILDQFLKEPNLSLFQKNISLINRIIGLSVLQEKGHSFKKEGVPGMYFFLGGAQIFINLKGTGYLGTGTYGKVRQVLWLDAPDSPTIVAKKVSKSSEQGDLICFQRELNALKLFQGKRGIISMIAGGIFEGKAAIFLPVYRISLFSLLHENKRLKASFTQKESLNLISQLLEGVATISKEGTHGDLSHSNLLLRGDSGGKIEIVISDFGSYRPHGQGQYGSSTITYAPPEYFALKTRGLKHDVWAVGTVLYELFSMNPCSWPIINDDKAMHEWTSTLSSGWVLSKPFRKDTPQFILELMNQMLDPCQASRPTAEECWGLFSSGYKSFAKR